MARPKGFVPAQCNECGNRGRHKTTCSRSGVRKDIETSKRHVPGVRRRRRVKDVPSMSVSQAVAKTDDIVEGGLPELHSRTSFARDLKCIGGDTIRLGERHWTDLKGRIMCMEHAAEIARRRNVT